MISFWRRPAHIPVLFFFLLLGLVVYRASLRSEFIYDDTIRVAAAVVEENSIHFEAIPPLKEGLGATLSRALPDRPLLMFSIWINYAISGENPYPYKATNILLHAFTAWLFYLFLLEVGLFFAKPIAVNLAFALGLIFLCHPLHSQAINMIIQRGVILATAFSLLALLFSLRFLRSPSDANRGFASAAYLAAILCKPNCLFIPFLVAWVAYAANNKKNLAGIFWPLLGCCLFPLLFYWFYLDNFYESSLMPGAWFTYFLVQSRVLFFYGQKIVWPIGLNSSYPIPASMDLAEVWPYLLGLGISLAAASFTAYKKRLPAVALIAFFISLTPESSFFPIPHVVFDHRMYFPFLFLALACAWAIPARFSQGRWFFIALMPLLVLLSALTHKRNLEVNSYVNWLASTAEKNPADPNAALNALNVLWSLEMRERGQRLASTLIAYNDRLKEYHFFLELFSTPSSAVSDFVHSALLDPNNNYWSEITRSNLLQSELNRYKKNPDLLRAREEIHSLLENQLPLFSSSYFDALRSLYYTNRAQLLPPYQNLADLGLLLPYQRELWYGVLLALGKRPAGLSSYENFLWRRYLKASP